MIFRIPEISDIRAYSNYFHHGPRRHNFEKLKRHSNAMIPENDAKFPTKLRDLVVNTHVPILN